MQYDNEKAFAQQQAVAEAMSRRGSIIGGPPPGAFGQIAVDQRAGDAALEELQRIARELAERVAGLAERVSPEMTASNAPHGPGGIPVGLLGKVESATMTLRNALDDLSRVERVI